MLTELLGRLSAFCRRHEGSYRGLVLLGLSAASSVIAIGLIRWNWIDYGKKALGFDRNKKRKKNGNVNIGAIFGMDVGGTLAKIVYFQPTKKDEALGAGVLQSPLIKRQSSESLAQLASPDHQAALQQLYNYVDVASVSSQSVVTRDDALSLHSDYLQGNLHFLHFETRNMITAIDHMSSAAVTENIKTIGCTGGGAHKYSKNIFDALDITLNKYDELSCLVRGMMFALMNFADECYTYRNSDEGEDKAPPKADDINPQETSTDNLTDESAGDSSRKRSESDDVPVAVKRWQKDSKTYTKRVILSLPSVGNNLPFLVVNIGSGVSILKVTGPGKYERVSGTSLGGGTYWGLCRLLTKCSSFDEVLDLAENGDAGTVDMLVKDIYGGDYGGMLTGSMVASSFGKLVMKEDPMENVKPEDLALAMLMMITNNIGQVAHLCAQLHGCSKIFFVGSFLRHNPISCRRLAFAIDFWSAGSMEALFLVHEGYFGALGTFLYSAFGEDTDRILTETQQQQESSKFVSGTSPANAKVVGLNGRSFSPTRGRGQEAATTSLGKDLFGGSQLNGEKEQELNDTPGSKGYSSAGRRGRSSSDDTYLRTTTRFN